MAPKCSVMVLAFVLACTPAAIPAQPSAPAAQAQLQPSSTQSVQTSVALPKPSRRQLLSTNFTIPARFTKPYNICTSVWKPIVVCAPNQDHSTYTGYQIELFRMLASDLGWDPADYVFTCIDWNPMIDDLASPTGNCMMAAAGLEMSGDLLSRGIKFSWPIYKAGYQVLIASAAAHADTWGFAKSFHWSVWVLLACSSVLVAIIIAVMEKVSLQHAANKQGLQGWVWLTLSMLVWVHHHVKDPKLWASRTLLLTYGFLLVIMVHLYAATAASHFTHLRLGSIVTSISDLQGKTVETWSEYEHILRKYGVMADGLPWDNDNDTAALVKNLRDGKYRALVLDSPVVEHLASTECDLFVVGEKFETYNLALAFPKDNDDQLIDAFSMSLVHLQSGSAALDKLENKYIKDGLSTCRVAADAHGSSADTQITLAMVSGLWYILAMSVGISLLLLIVNNVRTNPRAMARIHSATTAAAAAMRLSSGGGAPPKGSFAHPSAAPGIVPLARVGAWVSAANGAEAVALAQSDVRVAAKLADGATQQMAA